MVPFYIGLKLIFLKIKFKEKSIYLALLQSTLISHSQWCDAKQTL